METWGMQMSGAELIFNGGGCAGRTCFPLLWELIRGRAVAVEEEQHFISSSPSRSCYLVLHLWPLEAWLSSAAPPPATALTSSPRSWASRWPRLTGAQLSRAAGGWKRNTSEGHCYCCCRQWKINTSEPQRKVSSSAACNFMWSGANLNLIIWL